MPVGLMGYSKAYLGGIEDAFQVDFANVSQKFDDDLPIATMAEQRKDAGGLSAYHFDHFVEHWITPDAAGNSSQFPLVAVDRIRETLKQGFGHAVSLGIQDITCLWMAAADDETFEVVTVLNNSGDHATIIIVTPPGTQPRLTGARQPIWVTRYYASKGEIGNVEWKFRALGKPEPGPGDEPDIFTSPGKKVAENEAGTFRAWA